MANNTTMGRRSVFRGKNRKNRVQGIMTDPGSKAFEAARRRLAALVKWKLSEISDADTIEYLALGDDGTRAYLKRQAVSGK